MGADVQGALIERLSGMLLAQFFRKCIFEPLGMRDTFFEVPRAEMDRLVANYRYDSREKRPYWRMLRRRVSSPAPLLSFLRAVG
ncbi:MAG: hypothetical protein M2R45_03251 [Verrucomicrobia subdivision 3 bacterium]|nr:hypothetical protein [Limisphaerales bacterium]MCS1416112.1 hypothetical protein [Limisphaerales bacterium]